MPTVILANKRLMRIHLLTFHRLKKSVVLPQVLQRLAQTLIAVEGSRATPVLVIPLPIDVHAADHGCLPTALWKHRDIYTAGRAKVLGAASH